MPQGPVVDREMVELMLRQMGRPLTSGCNCRGRLGLVATVARLL